MKKSVNFAFYLAYCELKQMERYLDLINSSIEENKGKLSEDLEAGAKDLSGEDRYVYLIDYKDEMDEFEVDMPRILFSGVLTTWFSFIENHLVDICSKSGLKISIGFDDKWRSTSGMWRAHDFLSKGVGYEIDNSMWDKLTKISKIRNIIVHQDGKLAFSFEDNTGDMIRLRLLDNTFVYTSDLGDLKKGRSLASYLEQEQLIRYAQALYIFPSYIYCKGLISFGIDFLGKIYEDLEALGVVKKDKIGVIISTDK